MINGTNENQCTFEAFDDLMSITDNLYERLFTEASAKTPSQMRQIVDKLNRKGYKVKYASPGHQNTSFKNDVYSDHVINGKLTTTARVIFKNPETKVEPPYLWYFKVMDDCTGIYVKPYSYSKDSQGSPQEAFAKWQEQYMISLDEWASKLDNITGKTENNNINNSLNNMKSSLRWKE